MPDSAEIPDDILERYRSVIKLETEGAPGERQAATARRLAMEQRYVGISAELDRRDQERARSALRDQIREDFGVSPPDPAENLVSRLAARLKSRAVDWAVDKLAEAVEAQTGFDPSRFTHEARRRAKEKIMSLRDQLEEGEAEVYVEDVAIVDYDDGGRGVALSIEIPWKLWLDLVEGRQPAAELLAWLHATEVAEALSEDELDDDLESKEDEAEDED